MTRRARWTLTGAVLLAALATAGAMQLRGRGKPALADETGQPDGLRFRLSEGKPVEGAAAAVTPPAPAERLSDAAADKILARLKPLAALPGDEVDFALRESSLPAPRAGKTIDTLFPPPPSALAQPVVETGPLTVRRISPEGEVPAADRVSVTFSQPMVPVTSQEDAAKNVPVRLTPEHGGTWRWLGTQTLIFDAGSGKRLPASTAFTVTVPAGTKSLSGGTLAADAKVEFRTPTLRLLQQWPQGGGQPRDGLIWLAFDQKIDPDAVLKHVTVQANGQTVGARLATDAEVAAAKELRDYRGIPKERTLALKTTQTLPGNQSIQVTVGVGAPSTEGPLTTTSPQSWSYQTYGPFVVTDSRCTWETNAPCRPENPWQINFSNPIDGDAFDPAWVTISPKAPGATPMVYGNTLQIEGFKKGRTTYTVTLSPKIKDVYGQSLDGAKPIVFKIGPALPNVQGPGQPFTVLDPSAPPRAVFHSVNLRAVRVRLYAVTPADWEAWLVWLNGGPRRGNPPGREVSDERVSMAGEPDDWNETSVNLAPALKNGRGNVVVWWEASELRRPNQEPPQGYCWYQASRIGVSVHADPTDLYAWATDLSTGKALEKANLELVGTEQSLPSGRDGMARFTLTDKRARMLLVRHGDETAFLPSRFWQYDDGQWRRQGQGDSLRWFIFNDRGLYKPGETVQVKGWIRKQTAGKTGDLALIPNLGAAPYVLRDSRGNEVLKGTVQPTALGGFHVALTLPKTMNLGQAVLQINGFDHTFNVQEFRRPEFEVTAKSERPGPHVVGGVGADLSVKASYYAGGALPGAPASWSVSASPASYTPPGRSEYTFGRWTPWWGGGIDDGDGMVFRGGGRFGRPGFGGDGGAIQQLVGVTDANGVHRLHVDFDAVKPARPYTISAQAVIQDVNRQAQAASTSVLVHPSERYVGLRGQRLFVEPGRALPIDAIVCDIDGKLEAGREIRFRAARRVWGYKKGRWQESDADVKEWTVRSGKAAVTTEFAPKEGGTYSVRATVLDGKERANETELTLWVSGGAPRPQSALEQEKVTLIPSKKEYQPGESAEVLVQAPFWPAEGLLTLRHDGFVKVERFTMQGAGQVLRLPITEAYLPNVTLQIDLVGSSVRVDPDGKPVKNVARRPAFATGSLNLAVPATRRKLTVTAAPDQAATEPGGKTHVTVTVKDASGRPVANSEAAVFVVDESVLALAGWSLGDPIAAFYPQRGPGAYDVHLRSHLTLEDVQRVKDMGRKNDNTLALDAANGPTGGGGRARFGRGESRMALGAMAAAPMPMAPSRAMAKVAAMADDKDASGGDGGAPIAVRENFDALASYSDAVRTDSDGRAVVAVKLPDNLTRYRIVAVAVAGGQQAGSGEGSVTARLPLMARPSAPRFLNFGDQFELPVVVQNQTDAPMTVDVAVRAVNAKLTDGHGRRVTVPANDRVEVRFPAEAARPGTARFQLAAVSGTRSDAAQVSLPVWTPATTEAFATYGVVDNGAVSQPVQAPSDAVAAFGGLEVTTSSTALQELTDAVIYLMQYPYGCAEQISSRVLAAASLKDVLYAFKSAEMPSPELLNASVNQDLKRLEELQNDDGSFGFWTRGERPWPFLGVHVAHAIVVARHKDFTVPEPLWTRSMAYLKSIEQRFPADYPISCKRFITAYALSVRHSAGDSDKPRARRLLREASFDELGPETVGFCLQVIAADPESAALRGEVRAWLNNKTTETAQSAHFSFSYGDAAYFVLASNRRADAILLDALMVEEPKSDLIPKLVRGLLDGRKQGRWGSTQENAFTLVALDRYFRTYEKVTPDFVARLWLGEKLAGEAKFAGRTTDRIETKVPMRHLLQGGGGRQSLILGKEGPGRLYYRIGMRYAPKSLNLAAADYGFSVKRTYEAIDKASDVTRGSDGVWHVKAGAKVRVRVSMVATTRRYHVALVDPLPAGFESLNPEVRGTEQVPGVVSPQVYPGYFRGWWWGNWWEHQNLRDERAEAFASLLWEGAYEYVYVCRATTPGKFVVPPAKAEEMYSPETFGRSASDKVTVE